MVDRRVRLFQPGIDVATLAADLAEWARGFRHEGGSKCAIDRGPRFAVAIVGRDYQRCTMLRTLERIRDDDRDGLVGVEDGVVLQ